MDFRDLAVLDGQGQNTNQFALDEGQHRGLTAYGLGYQDLSGLSPEMQTVSPNAAGADDDNSPAGIDLTRDIGVQHLQQGIQVSGGTRFDERSGDHVMLGWFHAARAD